MGSRTAECVWLVFSVLMGCWTKPSLSNVCLHPLYDAAPTASGFLPINQSSGSKIFFVYYEAIQQNPDAMKNENFRTLAGMAARNDLDDDDDNVPILLWLQGGPGCSSMVGNFYELGPWRVGEDGCLHRNPAPWNRVFGLLFLDNPIGTGFSIAPLVEDIPTDQTGIARDVYTALEGFFSRFPTFRDRPFFLTGESYAGKYVPAVATYILERQAHLETSSFVQRRSPNQLRLDGVAIGNGLTHPIAQVQVHASTAYYMGLIDENQAEELQAMAAKAVAYIEEENWVDAHSARSAVLNYMQNVTGLATLYDVRRTISYHSTENGTDYLTPFMNKQEVQESLLNVKLQTWEDCSDIVASRMWSDVMKSTIHEVESLLNQSVPVLLYQGEFDLQDGVASTEAWMRLLRWDGLPSFYASKRKVWKENNVKVGYVRSYSLLTHVVISNAGHFVPTDQAFASQRMIEGWVSGVGLV